MEETITVNAAENSDIKVNENRCVDGLGLEFQVINEDIKENKDPVIKVNLTT